jgi:hypothetical protein
VVIGKSFSPEIVTMHRAVPVTEEMLQSRRVSENEIENRQRLLNGQISLLVP